MFESKSALWIGVRKGPACGADGQSEDTVHFISADLRREARMKRERITAVLDEERW